MPALTPSGDRLLSDLFAADCDPRARAELVRWIREGSDLDCYKVNAHRLAEVAGVDAAAALRVLLVATRLGVLDLNYDLYCPSCRGNADYVRQLIGLGNDAHCNLCRIDFRVSYLEQVEVTFTVSPQVRVIAVTDFKDRDPRAMIEYFATVIAREGRRFDVGEQFAPDTVGEARGDLREGRYLVYVPRHQDRPGVLEVSGPRTEQEQRLGVVAHADGSVTPGHLRASPGPLTLTVDYRYDAGGPAWPLLVMRDAEPVRWVSAAWVTTQQDFRDLFAGEFLAPGVEFAIRHTTLMFTDIRSSTELFEELGDSSAYALVQDHFGVMTECVRAGQGAIVKTIGDAVMASFPRAVDAVRSAWEIQAAFASRLVRGRRIEVKIGLHRGPAIAVTSNRNLDFFGRTVNMAARVQGCAGPGEVLLSDEVVADPEVIAWLAARRAAPERRAAFLKGIGGAALHAIRPTG